jgi:integrase
LPKRRAKGDGAVFKRSDGRWIGYVDLGWQDGRRVRKYMQGANRDEVRERVKAVIRSVDDGIAPPTSSPRLSDFLAKWLAAVKPALRPSTYVSYEGVVRLHLVPEIGRLTLDKLSIDHIANLLTRKQSDPRLSPTTVRYVLLVLRIALNKAVRWGLIARNLATLVDPPRVVHKEARVLAPEDTSKLLDAARGEPIEGLIVVAVSTGMRLGEALGLQWNDIDLERRHLRINKSLQRVSGLGQVLSETKTRRGRRSLVMPVIAVEALRTHRAEQIGRRRAAGSAWNEKDFVFTSSTGQPLDQRNVQRVFRRLLRRAKLPRMRFHDLRHSCASLLLAQHTDPRVIMETLGHSNISVTMNMYAHVMPTLKRDAADAIDRSLARNNELER